MQAITQSNNTTVGQRGNEATFRPGDNGHEFTDKDFDWLRRRASEHSGIVLPESKRNMLYSRLAKRLRKLGLTKFADYRALLEKDDQGEFIEFINALTTNLTSFFREPHHFRHLQEVAIPEILEARPAQSRLRIWSAGCSTGEEPYTISMAVSQALASLRSQWQYQVLATDLDTNVLKRAASGIYDDERTAELTLAERRSWFLRGSGAFEGKVLVRPEIQTPISFRQLNLVQNWSFREPFDIIFCRNVAIYFDRPTQNTLFNKYADTMVLGGYLYIGHSESLLHAADRFRLVETTTYRKIG